MRNLNRSTEPCAPVTGSNSLAKPNLLQNNPLFPGITDSSKWTIPDEHYKLLRDAILDLLDLDLNYYRTQQMERRLSTLLERRPAKNWPDYVASLRQEQVELEYFQDFITINVSSFYRDAEKWNFLHEHVLPELGKRSISGLNAWSVGCSIGAEAYTLAMLLSERADRRRHTIWATDIDMRVLERAKAGGPYFQNDLRELPPHFINTYMTSINEHLYTVKPALRAMTEFSHFNLLKDEADRKFDLIMCRNVVIYFTVDVKPQVYARLARALRPGGYFFIGSTETIANYQALGFEYIAPSFYRYVGS